jgi:hypothetical protein
MHKCGGKPKIMHDESYRSLHEERNIRIVLMTDTFDPS